MNEQPLPPIENPLPEQPVDLNPQPFASDELPPLVTQHSSFGPAKKPPKKKPLLLALILLIIIGAATAFYLSKNKTATPAAKLKSTLAHLVLPNQPKQLNDQFGTQNVTTGYVKYEPTKFKTIDTTLPKLPSIVPAVVGTTDKEVVFITSLNYQTTPYSKRLLMYDVVSKLTYVVAQDSSVGTYVNPKIMSNHYVVYAALNQTDPLTNNTDIRVTDLDTGDTKTILSDKGSNLPASLCCAVSPDGLRLVIPQTNKFLIYQAGETQPTAFSGDVQVFPKTQGTDNSDYAASQRNYGYPNIVWLDDNNFMYAKAQPKQFTVDKDGTHAAVNNNGLAIYNLTSGTSNDVAKTSTIPVKWFSVDGTGLVFAGYKPNVSGLTDSNSGIIIYHIIDYRDSSSQVLELASQPDYQATLTYSSFAKMVYVQPSALDSYGDLNGGPSKILQTINVSSGAVGTAKIGDVDGYALQGMIGPHQLVLDTSTTKDTIYSLYDLTTSTSTQIFTATKGN